MAETVQELFSPAQASKLAHELSERVGKPIEAPQVRAMAKVVQTRDPDVLGFVREFLTVAEAKIVRREALVASLTKALNAVTHASADDPLHEVDEPLPLAEASSAVALAEAQATETRRAILRDCLSAERAARLTRRSRQSLERFRRAGRVLALREGNQWLYPRWQFAPDARGGIIGGLQDVLARLRLSPLGAAYWLTRRHERLKTAPIKLLRSGRVEPVLEAAREYGERL